MEFYDVGSSDLRELWESYLSEPVSTATVFLVPFLSVILHCYFGA